MDSLPKIQPNQKDLLQKITMTAVDKQLDSLMPQIEQALGGIFDLTNTGQSICSLPWTVSNTENSTPAFYIQVVSHTECGWMGCIGLDTSDSTTSVDTFNAFLEEVNWQGVIIQSSALFSFKTFFGKRRYVAVHFVLPLKQGLSTWDKAPDSLTIKSFTDTQELKSIFPKECQNIDTDDQGNLKFK